MCRLEELKDGLQCSYIAAKIMLLILVASATLQLALHVANLSLENPDLVLGWLSESLVHKIVCSEMVHENVVVRSLAISWWGTRMIWRSGGGPRDLLKIRCLCSWKSWCGWCRGWRCAGTGLTSCFGKVLAEWINDTIEQGKAVGAYCQFSSKILKICKIGGRKSAEREVSFY